MPTLNRQTQIILTIITAAIILGVIALVNNRSQQPIAQPAADTSANNEWPTPPPTFTATPLATATPVPSPTPLPSPTPSPTPIIVGWQALGHLTSVEYTLQTVVEAQRTNEGLIGGLLGQDKVLMVAVGNIHAGIDMTQITPQDVDINGTRVKISLPSATISSVELLPDQTEIFDSSQRWILSEYEGLETEALEQARTQLEAWAVEQANVLTLAETLAQLQLREFLQTLGFTDIEINIKN